MLVKTPFMDHQRRAFQLMEGRKFFALLMEQGTGKTLVLLANSLRSYSTGEVDGALVIAPNGVHINWVVEEIPKHVPDYTPLRAAYWSATPNRKERDTLWSIFDVRKDGEIPPIRILTMNVEALNTEKGFEMAERFLLSGRMHMIIDESQRIKNSRARRTKAAKRLKHLASARFISTGTAVTKSPVDAFSQFQFLEDGLLGTNSETAFRAEYCELLPPGHGLMRHIMQRTRGKYVPQVVARDEEGRPKYRNLEQLQKLIEPHSFRVLKSECMDLPEKIYQTRFFHLSASQRKAYKQMEDELRFELSSEEFQTVSSLASLVKLQEITSGYIKSMGDLHSIGDSNPRISLLMDVLEDLEGSVIIWARFRKELDDIESALKAAEETYCVMHGGVKVRDRPGVIRSFQNGEARVFLGQPQSGGIGIDLTKAETVIYFSNDFNLETRLQSEDRAHRKGTVHKVAYIDLVALDTIDERIVSSLQRKQDVAAAVMGDFLKHKRGG